MQRAKPNAPAKGSAAVVSAAESEVIVFKTETKLRQGIVIVASYISELYTLFPLITSLLTRSQIPRRVQNSILSTALQ